MPTLIEYLANPHLMQQLPQIQQIAPINYVQPMKPMEAPAPQQQQDSGSDIGALVGQGASLWKQLHPATTPMGTNPVDYVQGQGPLARSSLPAQAGPSFMNNFGGLYP